MSGSFPPSLADVHRAAERIRDHAVRTPLLRNHLLDEHTGGRILLKCENVQRTGSFKFRGACNALASLDHAERARGVVSASSGNHAQGVAEAARVFGIDAMIVMPSDAPALKRIRTERSGATVVEYDRGQDDRDALVAAIVRETGRILIHPYDDARVIAGQGTAGLEIIEDLSVLDRAPDLIAMPCGGGGLSAGVGLAVRSRFPDCEIVLTEPEGFDDYGRSLVAGRRLANASATGSVCDALMARAPGALGFAINTTNSARGVTIEDREALAGVAYALRELKLVVEPGGAAALAALLAGRIKARDRTVVLVLSGGNIDEAVLARALGEV